jgi:hypothetical protein
MFSEAAGCFSGRYAGVEEKNAFEAGIFLSVPRVEPMMLWVVGEFGCQKRHN